MEIHILQLLSEEYLCAVLAATGIHNFSSDNETSGIIKLVVHRFDPPVAAGQTKQFVRRRVKAAYIVATLRTLVSIRPPFFSFVLAVSTLISGEAVQSSR